MPPYGTDKIIAHFFRKSSPFFRGSRLFYRFPIIQEELQCVAVGNFAFVICAVGSKHQIALAVHGQVHNCRKGYNKITAAKAFTVHANFALGSHLAAVVGQAGQCSKPGHIGHSLRRIPGGDLLLPGIQFLRRFMAADMQHTKIIIANGAAAMALDLAAAGCKTVPCAARRADINQGFQSGGTSLKFIPVAQMAEQGYGQWLKAVE